VASARGVGDVVVRVGDQAEQLRGVLSGDADPVFDDPHGEGESATADGGQVRDPERFLPYARVVDAKIGKQAVVLQRLNRPQGPPATSPKR
jgi:hypothetical protein